MLGAQRRSGTRRAVYRAARGFTLIELIVATAIMVILVSMAVPVTSFAIKRERERELRYDLWMMRDAIDRYKDAADRAAFQIKLGSEGYPPDLETLSSPTRSAPAASDKGDAHRATGVSD